MIKHTLILLITLLATQSFAQKTIKVACIGNSVTYGAGIENRETDAYPFQLQRMLGDKYEVRNFGHNGATLLRKGHRPYIEQSVYVDALGFKADKVIIHLGLNDTDPRNWPNFQEEFIEDYLFLINSFRLANPQCEIWICRMTPIRFDHHRFKSGTRDWYWQIQEKIETVAQIAGCTLIDLQKGLYNYPNLLPDAIHPNSEGAGIIATTVYGALSGEYGGLKMAPIYSDNMVLQQNEPLKISGTANGNTIITVKIGSQHKESTTKVDGTWEIHLDPMTHGNPLTLEITSTAMGKRKRERKVERLQFNNVRMGEVWLCSGQSNMAFTLRATDAKEREEMLKYIDGNPDITLFNLSGRWETYATEWDSTVMDSLNRLKYFASAKWEKIGKENAANFSTIALFYAKMLADSLGAPIGLIHNAVGGSTTESWIDRKTLEFEFTDILYNWIRNDFIQEWARGRAVLNTKKSPYKSQHHPYEPCYLFESGILPLNKYPINGIIWYQGESNAHNIEVHERLFPLLIKSWRENWGKNLSFYFVQLSSLNRPSWPRFRESQRKMSQTIHNTAMAVSSDRGDSLDVHPRRKKDIGTRLARLALNGTYNKKVTPSGPMYKEVQFENDAAYVSFYNDNGMTSEDGKELRGFEIGTTEGLFVEAKAVVTGNRVKVWNENVKNPGYVRYGWKPYTNANLINCDSLPASTFITNQGKWNKEFLE